MYLWNINKLASDLKDNTVSEGEKVKYFIFSVFWSAFFHAMGPYSCPNPDQTTLILSVIYIICLPTGVWICYRANSGGDGQNFLERFICLCVPICVRLTLFAIVFFFLFGITLSLIPINVSPNITIVVYIVYFAGYFWWIKRKISWISAG